MSKNPVPQYFVGRKGGKAETAWTQERGAEMITDRHGNIKTLGSDSGATLTKLAAGDNVFTAEETRKFLESQNMEPGTDLYRKIAMKGIAVPIINQNKDNSDAIAEKIGGKFDAVMKKYDKVNFSEDENGNIFRQEGGKIPVFVGKKKVKVPVIKISRNERN